MWVLSFVHKMKLLFPKHQDRGKTRDVKDNLAKGFQNISHISSLIYDIVGQEQINRKEP